MLRWFEKKQVYHPTREWVTTGAELSSRWEDVYFTSADGVRLNAWSFPAESAAKRSQFAALVCHGNGGNVSHRLDAAQLLLNAGLNVLLLEYRGYGRSEGKPGEEGTYLDAVAAHGWLASRGFGAGRIIGYGESLGGGVVSELAMRCGLGGVILVGAFTSIADIGAELFPWLPVRRIARIKYDTLSRLPRIHAPVLLMHSREDTLIGYRHAERNFAAANEPKLLWELSGDHNDSLRDNIGGASKGVEEFMQLVEGPGHARAD